MITVRLLGGARRSFGSDSVDVGCGETTVGGLLGRLSRMVPPGAPPLDAAGVLVAVNGADSSAAGGAAAPVRPGDSVSIIPVVHGGSRVQMRVGGRLAEAFPVSRRRSRDAGYLDSLRARFPRVAIQAVSRRHVIGRSHLQKVLAVSLHARRRRAMLARRLETDLLLRLAGTTQISRAIAEAGISPGRPALVVAVGPRAELDRVHAYLRPDLDPEPFLRGAPRFLARRLGITARHLRAVGTDAPLEDLLAERAAVLF